MTIQSPDFREFISLLNANKVNYMIVGGYAVGVYGYPRYTGDMDIWVQMYVENAEKVIQTLHDFGFPKDNFNINDFTQPNKILQLGYPPLRIDILTTIDGVSFETCYERRTVIDLEGLAVNFISLDDLKANKLASGRDKDRIDVENLEKENKKKGKKK